MRIPTSVGAGYVRRTSGRAQRPQAASTAFQGVRVPTVATSTPRSSAAGTAAHVHGSRTDGHRAACRSAALRPERAGSRTIAADLDRRSSSLFFELASYTRHGDRSSTTITRRLPTTRRSSSTACRTRRSACSCRTRRQRPAVNPFALTRTFPSVRRSPRAAGCIRHAQVRGVIDVDKQTARVLPRAYNSPIWRTSRRRALLLNQDVRIAARHTGFEGAAGFDT